jgi:hypothetical protein
MTISQPVRYAINQRARQHAPDGALPGACEAFTLPTRFVRRAEGSLYPPSSATWTTCAAPSSIPLAVTWDDASPRVERSCIR